MASTAGDTKTQVLQATSIVDLIGKTVALKRRGKDFVGLCPFHQEKTPSFHVSPSKQFFHCYGCKAGGNAIDFVMQRDRVTFVEALRLLAQEANIELPKFGGSKEKTGQRQLLLDAHSAAGAFFEKSLSHPQQGLAARQYLEKRGFTAETVRHFGVGVAADSWDALLKGPVGRKFTAEQLALAGLVKTRERGGGYYDTFRNRLMFPIRDENGRTIAFGGRVMPGSEDPAKYLNSPETPLFSKSRCIFALDLARQAIVESRTVVLVEGYTDAMMAHQFSVANVVSILGTAMTEQHVAVLRRYADRIVLLFDADSAGDTAASRSVELFLTQPIEIRVATMPAGVDPDEYLLEHGADAFRKILETSVDALTYKWKQLLAHYSAQDELTGQQKAVEQYLETLAAARRGGPVDTLRWGAALARVNRLTGIPIEQLQRRFKMERPRPAGAAAPQPAAPSKAQMADAAARAERWILGVLLNEPHRWSDAQHRVGPADFQNAACRRLAEVYWNHQRDEGEPLFKEFLALLEEQELRALAVGLVDETADFNAGFERTLADACECLVRRRQEQQTQAQIAEAADEIDFLSKVQAKALLNSARNKNV